MVGRNLILGMAAAFVASLFLFGMPEMAHAQCCAPPPPPCCHAPNPPPPACCHVPSPPPQNPVCCVPGHNVNIPGVNVFVGANVIVNAQVNASATASSQAQGQGQVIVMGGGGGGGGGVIAPSGGVIQGLNVEGGMRRVSYEALRIRTRRVVIQAFCFDDLNNPHPASQVTPDREINDMYDGELWRCIAGTHMQVTFVEWHAGRIDFSGGETITCGRGEALYHVPFHGGGRDGDGDLEEGHAAPPPTVMCRPQRPARDCNERSLLRRYGAGVKILTMIRIERYQAFREEHYQQSSSSSSAFSMDGGVGGVAY
jgi:hypothetical protein